MEKRLVTPKTVRSGVWQHFGFEGDENGEIMCRKSVWCRHCQSRLAYSGNTTNMSVHLAKCRNYTSAPKPVTETLVPKKKITASPDQSLSSITSAVLKFIIANMEPITLVENKEFRELLSAASKDYQLPCPRTVLSIIEFMTNDTRKYIFEELQSVEHVCLSIEIWVTVTMENYLGMACHFIDANWELQTRVLMPEVLPTCFTSETIASLLASMEKKWYFTNKVLAYVADDSEIVVNAIEILLEAQHLCCVAHAIQYSVNKGLAEVPDVVSIIDKCRKIVENFKQETPAMNELTNIQQKHGLESKTLVKDIETQWRSTYNMLQSMYEQRDAINSVLRENDETRHLILAKVDVQNLEAICNVLEPFVEATTYLGGEKYVSASIVSPIFYNLKKALVAKPDDPSYIEHLKTTIIFELDKKQKNLGPLLDMAAALDPRFKSLKYLSEEERHTVWNALENELIDNITLTTLTAANLTEHFNKKSNKSNHSTTPTKKLRLMDDSDDGEDEDAIKTEDIAAKELQTYRAQKKVDCEPTVWWKINAATHPNLVHMARKYLGLVATSIPSERFFSTDGYLLSNKRANISGPGIKELLFMHGNRNQLASYRGDLLLTSEATAVIPYSSSLL